MSLLYIIGVSNDLPSDLIYQWLFRVKNNFQSNKQFYLHIITHKIINLYYNLNSMDSNMSICQFVFKLKITTMDIFIYNLLTNICS